MCYMASFFSSLFAWFSSLLFSKNAEICIVGLQASGKTSMVNVVGEFLYSCNLLIILVLNQLYYRC